jgi:beta-aspartyl-peptidase (threonine type)
MELIENGELVLDRERVRLRAAQERAARGLKDETFSGELLDDKGPETAMHQGLGTEEQGTGNEERGTGTEEQGIGNREQGTEAWDEGLDRDGEDDDPTGFSHDTVGAVALDAHGNLAAGTSTGGTLNKAPGRVGDSSLIGCGCYADNLSAAVSLTGWGEPIMKLVLGKWATDRVAAGMAPELAAREAIAYLFNRMGGHGGIILLGPDGRFGYAHNTPAMAWGVATGEGFETGVRSF